MSMNSMRAISRRAFLFIALWTLGACASASQSGRNAEPIRAMTFNIRYGTARDGVNVWAQRRPLTFKVIDDFDPTVLGVQEALRFQLDEIEQAFPGYGEVGVGRDDGRTAGEYSAILYDKARLEVLEQGTFWLSDTPEQPGSMTWGNRYPRVVTWARFRDRAADRRFYVFNTHWDHESQPARERGAALMLSRIAGRSFADEPVLVMGDFNSGETNPAFRTLVAGTDTGVRLADSFRAIHPDATEVGTYHAFKGSRSGDKIDAILISPHFRVMSADIVHESAGDVYPSDHFPVTAVVGY